MADLTITATSVIAASDAVTEIRPAGAVTAAGQVVYLDTTTDTYKLADTDSATAAARSPRGIALNGGAIGQPIQIIRSGGVTIGATVAVGVGYWLSGTAGGICPVADVAAGDYPVFLGIGTSTSAIKVNITEAGAVMV